MKILCRFASALSLLTLGVAGAPLHDAASAAPAPRPRSAAGPSRIHEHHVIEIHAGAGGAVQPGGAVAVVEGADQTIVVQPHPHHHVVDVRVDGVSVGPVTRYTFAGVHDSHTFEADFALDRHTLTVTAGPGGSASRAPDRTDYAWGDTVTVAAAALPGYRFAGWSGDAAGSDNPLAVVVDGDRSVAAAFEVLTHAIVATAGSHGAIEPAGVVAVPHDSSQTFAIAPGAGYRIADVRVDGASVGRVAAYTFEHVTAPHAIEAAFELDVRRLTVAVTGEGAVVRTPDLEHYAPGQVVELDVAEGANHRFVGWGGDLAGSARPVQVVMDADHHVTATFVEAIPPAVHVEAPNGGETWTVGDTVTLRWTAADASSSTPVVDLLLSRSGPAGPFAPLALGVPNTGAHPWVVSGPVTRHLVLRVVAADSAGNVGADASDATATVQETPFPWVVCLRADSAAGAGPHPALSNASPWVDLAGDHDASLYGFVGTGASGWKGDGTVANPYRLEFGNEEAGLSNRVTIPAGSVPELQEIGPVTAAVWFRTGYDAPMDRWEYILEWVQHPRPDWHPEYEGQGMSIITYNGRILVYHYPWIDCGPAEPGTWYHVVVVKDTNDLRVYVNGERRYTGTKTHRGIQQSEIVMGASTYRVFEGMEFPYTEWWTGAIAQMSIGVGAMTDAQVQALFDADRRLYVPEAPAAPAPPERVLLLRANAADGSRPHAGPGAASPWVDLTPPRADGALLGFDGTAASGWQGDGSPGSPHVLRFDGVDDRVAIPGRTVAELQNVTAVSAELWVKPGSDILSPDPRYLLEWVQGQGSTTGMSLMAAEGRLQLFLGNPYWMDVAPISPDTWYHVVVVKQTADVRCYVNGVRVLTAGTPHLGDQVSELLIGASTWRGPGIHGDFMSGDLGALTLWSGTLTDSAVAAAYHADRSFAFGLAGLEDLPPLRTGGLELGGFQPNPVRDRLRASLTLPSDAPATLELIDVSGRRLRHRTFDSLGPGRHLVDLGDASGIQAGVYFLRLSHQGATRTGKAILMR